MGPSWCGGSVESMVKALPLPLGTLDGARTVLANVRAALARHPQDARLAPALGHAAALVALLDATPDRAAKGKPSKARRSVKQADALDPVPLDPHRSRR
jgi:hypothetical protein